MPRIFVVISLLLLAGCTEANRPDWLNRANAQFEQNMNQYPGGALGWGIDAAIAGEQYRAARALQR